MELKVIDVKNQEKGKIKVPVQFDEEVRPDLIKRAVLAIQSHARQAYGAKPDAGLRASADLSRRRRAYRGSYGFGISRVPRKILLRRGTRMYWVGAEIPGTVGGRRAHPPKSEKIWAEKLNVNENRKAIRSAMAATLDKTLVEARGHKVPENYPFVMDDDFEKITKTKELKESLLKLGFEEELKRSSVKKIRAGRGKSRGRPYKKKKGLLIVVSERCPLVGAAKSMPGVDVVEIRNLNTELLAPGTDVGRVTLFTKKSLDLLEKEKYFVLRRRLPKARTTKTTSKKIIHTEEDIDVKKTEEKETKTKKASKTTTKKSSKKAPVKKATAAKKKKSTKKTTKKKE